MIYNIRGIFGFIYSIFVNIKAIQIKTLWFLFGIWKLMIFRYLHNERDRFLKPCNKVNFYILRFRNVWTHSNSVDIKKMSSNSWCDNVKSLWCVNCYRGIINLIRCSGTITLIKDSRQILAKLSFKIWSFQHLDLSFFYSGIFTAAELKRLPCVNSPTQTLAYSGAYIHYQYWSKKIHHPITLRAL